MSTATATVSNRSGKKEASNSTKSAVVKNAVVADRVANLRTLAESDPQAAQDQAWTWLQELAELPSADSAQRDLLALLAIGTPADVDGRSDGVLLRWVDENHLNLIGKGLFAVVKGYVAAFGSPWLGKKYDQVHGRGTNTLTPAAKWLTRLISPRYRMHRNGDVYEGFEMYTRVQKSVLVPDSEVLVLDFQPAELGNPWPVHLIHDEVVEIAAGVFLGTKTLRVHGGYQQVAWWATKNPVEA